jgi:hypothetical protein
MYKFIKFLIEEENESWFLNVNIDKIQTIVLILFIIFLDIFRICFSINICVTINFLIWKIKGYF